MIVAQCADCKHRTPGQVNSLEELACDAFPDGIPQAILELEHDHTQPYTGDHGIRYEPRDGIDVWDNSASRSAS